MYLPAISADERVKGHRTDQVLRLGFTILSESRLSSGAFIFRRDKAGGSGPRFMREKLGWESLLLYNSA